MLGRILKGKCVRGRPELRWRDFVNKYNLLLINHCGEVLSFRRKIIKSVEIIWSKFWGSIRLGYMGCNWIFQLHPISVLLPPVVLPYKLQKFTWPDFKYIGKKLIYLLENEIIRYIILFTNELNSKIYIDSDMNLARRHNKNAYDYRLTNNI